MSLPSPAQCRKAIVAVAGLAAQGISLGLFHGTVLDAATAIVAAATALGVYRVPNAKFVAPTPAGTPKDGLSR